MHPDLVAKGSVRCGFDGLSTTTPEYKLAVKFGALALIHYRTKGWLFKYCLYGMGDARASVFLTNYYHSVVSDSSTELLTKTLPHR
jgi:hypothetical protein